MASPAANCYGTIVNRSSGVGELLVRAGLIDSSGLSRAVEIQSKGDVSLGRALADLGLADENAVSAAIAQALRLEQLGAELPEIAPELEVLLPMKFCQKHFVVPLNLKGNSLRLGMADPLDYPTIQDVMFRSSKEVVPVVASQTSKEALLNKFPSEAAEAEETYESLTGAVQAGASDIHVEPKERTLLIRQRVDGLLHDVFRIPKHLQDATISRLKIISGMDISDRRRPQDGRSQLRFEGKRIDLRVSTLPTQYGEKVVI